MEQKGQVVKTEGPYAYIVVNRPSACGTSCESCPGSCAESKAELIRLENIVGAKPGEFVTLETNSGAVLSYIGLVYGLPLVFFLVGVILTHLLLKAAGISNQYISLAGGFVLLAVSYLIIKKVDVNYKDRTSLVVLKR